MLLYVYNNKIVIKFYKYDEDNEKNYIFVATKLSQCVRL